MSISRLARVAPTPAETYSSPLTRADVLTVSEVAELLRLPRSTVYDLARRGLLPGHRVGRCWRFIRPEIEAWFRSA
jgi:excisionase family DNA binding protein